MSSVFLAIDLKSFYASVECVERSLDPLTTNLVVADPTRTEKTICLAVSPSLKAHGLSGRCRLFEVEQKAREVQAATGKPLEYIVAPPRMAQYIDYSSRIYAIYLRYIAPEDIHVYSIDECFMDITKYLPLYGMSARTLAMTLIRAVLADTGITATAGLGTNLYLCKIAMDIVAKHAAPDENGVRMAALDEQSYRRLLWEHTPLTDFWRIGAGTARRLAHFGVHTMGDLARMSLTGEEQLYRTFGVDAELLIDHAWGAELCTMESIKAYRPSTNCLSSGQVLHQPYSAAQGRLIVHEMTELLALELVEKTLACASFTLLIGYDRESLASGTYHGEVVTDHYGRSVPKSAHGTAKLGAYTTSTAQIVSAVLALYDRIVDPALLVRRVTLTANALQPQREEQLDLFTDPRIRAREQTMQHTMLRIRQRFGKNAILKGMNLQEGATTIERNRQIGGHKA